MAERYLMFAEVQQHLGLSSDEVRELMESKTLHGVVLDGVIKFHESEVIRLRGKSAGPAGGKPDKDMGLVFLVDEEEEKRIEGKAYDGEELLKGREPDELAPDEEIMEPVELSEEQLRNSAVLGTGGAVEFGREVAERAGKEKFTSAELSEGEEIIDSSKVELPEPEFGRLATALPEARREEPPRPETPSAPEKAETPVEPEAERPREELIRPTLRTGERAPAAPAPAGEKAPVTAPPEEEVVEAAARAQGEAAAEKVESEAVELRIEGEPEPIRVVTPEKGLAFVEEETGPMVCPVPPAIEGAPAEEAAARPPVTEQIAPVTPVAAPTLEEEKPEPLSEEIERTFEVTPPAPMVPVTESFERAVDEDLGDLEAEPEPVRIEDLVSKEEVPSAKEPGEREVPEAISEEVEAPAAESEIASREGAESVEEEPAEEAARAEFPPLERAVPAERMVPEAEIAKTPVEQETGAPAGFEKPVAADWGKPASFVPVEEPLEEVEQVTEEKKKEEEKAKPSEEKPVPPAEEEKKAEEGAVPESIEVFDLEAPAGKGGEGEEELVTLEEEAPVEEAAGAEAAKERTLEEEMAELFGEEKPERPAEEAFAAQAPVEDFDLSVFQKGTGGEQAMPVAEEALFEVGEQGTPAAGQAPVEEAVPDVETVSRIRALTEERRAPGALALTAAALLAFVVLAFTGMLLWHVFITR